MREQLCRGAPGFVYVDQLFMTQKSPDTAFITEPDLASSTRCEQEKRPNTRLSRDGFLQIQGQTKGMYHLPVILTETEKTVCVDLFCLLV